MKVAMPLTCVLVFGMGLGLVAGVAVPWTGVLGGVHFSFLWGGGIQARGFPLVPSGTGGRLDGFIMQ